MNRFLKGVARAVAETFALPGPILEIGSFKVPGQEELADLRSLFPGKSYTGIDIRPGPGVDCVASVEALPQEDVSVGSVIAMSTFEHVQRFWRGFAEIRRVLRPDGVLLVSCPFHVRIHNHPSDYWRFTPEALEVLLEDYPQRIVGWHGAQDRPENVWAVAFCPEYPTVTAEQVAAYQERLRRYGKQPIPWRRKLRYRLIDLIDRRRLCAPLLEVERWGSKVTPRPVHGQSAGPAYGPLLLRGPAN
jgi:SAM-dependent methyltransferase